jgi:hypothetical protein
MRFGWRYCFCFRGGRVRPPAKHRQRKWILLVDLHTDHKNGGNMSLRNVCKLVSYFMTSHLKRQCSSQSLLWEPQSCRSFHRVFCVSPGSMQGSHTHVCCDFLTIIIAEYQNLFLVHAAVSYTKYNPTHDYHGTLCVAVWVYNFTCMLFCLK